MRVPAADIRKRHFESDVALDQLRDLLEMVAEGRLRILGAILGLVLQRIGGLEHLHRFEHVFAGAVNDVS